ncbi:MAG: zinc dependent phospholipase C family protein [Clostridia bacterium]|nr:zinc dependent phospholipase C family protein [Clostridia bacterium]
MASWMIHFRVAEVLIHAGILGEASSNALSAFVLGNIAPDSGVPNPDGRGYMPNKDTSHFMRIFESGVRDRCDTHGFAAEWLSPALDEHDPVAAAFYLGYLSHLVTDNAWIRDIVLPAKARFAHLRLEDGVETPAAVARFYAFLKKDWYDMDFLYFKRNPDLLAYRLFLSAEDVENRYLPYFPADAFARKREEIEEFYRIGTAEAEERETYLSEDELDEFVRNIGEAIFEEFGDLASAVRSKLTFYPQVESEFMVK